MTERNSIMDSTNLSTILDNYESNLKRELLSKYCLNELDTGKLIDRIAALDSKLHELVQLQGNRELEDNDFFIDGIIDTNSQAFKTMQKDMYTNYRKERD